MTNFLRGVSVMVIAAAVGSATFAEPTRTASNTGGDQESRDTNGKSSDAKPDAKPKPRKLGQTEALTKAVAELQKEFKEWAEKPQDGALKVSPDYFKGLPEDTTVEDVLAVLAGGMSGPPSQQAYVKLQLTSALPAKVDGPEQTKLAFQAYKSAPRPVPAFASEPQIRSRLDRALSGLKEEQRAELEDAFEREKKKALVNERNAPILAYRTAMYARLPVAPETIVAGFGDLVERLECGVDTNKMLDVVMADIRTWAAIDAKPEQIQGMLSAISKLKQYKARNVSYTGKIHKDSKSTKWQVAPVQLHQKNLEALEKHLREAAHSGGGGGLKFKDDKDDKKKK